MHPIGTESEGKNKWNKKEEKKLLFEQKSKIILESKAHVYTSTYAIVQFVLLLRICYLRANSVQD